MKENNNALVGSVVVVLLLIAGAFVYNHFSAQWAQEAEQQAQERADLAEKLDNTQKRLDELANKPPQIITREVPSGGDADYSAIVAEWENRVAEVTCYWDNEDGQTEIVGSGSALLATIATYGFVAMTNRHVITYAGITATRCAVGLYGGGYRLTGSNSPGGNPFLVAQGDRDSAYIRLSENYLESRGESNGLFDAAAKASTKICSESSVKRGDRLVVLGYPVKGTQGGITVTDGGISGIENDYYVTEAKIDSGNSGGAAILVKDDCYLGIPTSVSVGNYESYGKILKTDLFTQ